MSRIRSTNPRGAISKERVLQAALELIDREGLSGLSLRKLAAQTGVSTMSIYRHYRNKGEIEMDIVDHVVGVYGVTDHDEPDIADWLLTTYTSMRVGLCAHPGLLALLDNTASNTTDAAYQGQNALVVMDAILGRLSAAGVTPDKSARLLHLLMAMMIGSVLMMNEAARQAIARDDSEASSEQTHLRRLILEMASIAGYPHIAEIAPHLACAWETATFRDDLLQIITAFTVGTSRSVPATNSGRGKTARSPRTTQTPRSASSTSSAAAKPAPRRTRRTSSPK